MFQRGSFGHLEMRNTSFFGHIKQLEMKTAPKTLSSNEMQTCISRQTAHLEMYLRLHLEMFKLPYQDAPHHLDMFQLPSQDVIVVLLLLILLLWARCSSLFCCCKHLKMYLHLHASWDVRWFTSWDANTRTSWDADTCPPWDANTRTSWDANTRTPWGANLHLESYLRCNQGIVLAILRCIYAPLASLSGKTSWDVNLHLKPDLRCNQGIVLNILRCMFVMK